MTPEEQFADLQYAMKQLIHAQIDRVWTALPASVVAWNYPATGKNTVTLRIGIMGEELQSDGSHKAVEMPQLLDVPVHYTGGGGLVITHPLAAGDEGMAMFSARPIDFWWQQGGAQPRGVRRRHSLSDAMFVPGLKSVPNTPPSISQTTTQIRSQDGSTYLEMGANAGGNTQWTLVGNLLVKGTITATGSMTAGQDGTDQVGLQSHTHESVQSGTDHSGPPVQGS